MRMLIVLISVVNLTQRRILTASIFANGVLAPNNKAENKAAMMEPFEPVTGESCFGSDNPHHAGESRLGPHDQPSFLEGRRHPSRR